MLSAPNYRPVPKVENQTKTLLLNRFLFTLFVLLSAFIPQRVWAQSVKSANDGTKTIINQNGNQFNITGGVLSSDQANLFHSFSQFSLNQNQIANFISQPQIKNILARVVGGNASIINGLIEVTGGNSNLFLMNPAGIVFGTHAQLNVPASFTATTATGIGFENNMSFNATGLNDYASLVGNPQNFAFQISQPGSVINAGVLQVAQGQNLLLLGGNAINTGTLTAPSGNLTIAAVPGSSLVRVSQLGHLLSLEISPQQANISNGITALTLPELLTGAGLNPATGVTVDGSGQTALVSGHLNVSGETGGTVEVVGNTVSLIDAHINASGKINGGTVLIGGDYQGKGTIPDSQVTFVDDKSEIKADAINSGNGGEVIVWSNDNTDFSGTISAKGGIQNGNGGFVETSGKQQLKYTGLVDLRATNGETGNLLLDPATFVIANSGGDTTPAVVASQWNTANTTYSATTSLTVASSVTGNSANNLTLDAPTINLNAPITNAGAGNLTGTTNNITVNVGSNGLIQNGIDVAATGGNVNLAAVNYNVSQPVAIGKSLTVTGAGASSTIVNGGGTSRVFDISGNGTNVALSEIEITNGNASNGGGIQVGIGSLLTLTDSNLVSNSASSGGSIYLNGGTATISNSTFSGNSASSGGGIYSNNGTATISNSTFSGNSASSGGGIYLNNGTATISNSTFSGNSASFGGGIYNNFATVSVTNSIIAGDTATVSNNEVYSNGGTFTANGYNLVGVNGNAGGFPTTSSDIVLSGAIGTAIAPLSNNGGNTETFALVANSPAIDAGNNTGSPSTDQRGALRGGFGGLNAGSKIDIGAFEATSSYVVSNTLDSSGLPLGSLRSAISFADNNVNNNPANMTTPDANTITFDDSSSGVFSSPQTILLTAGELPITQSTIIRGTGSSNLNISGNGNSRIFDISGSGTIATLNYLTISNGNAGSNNGGGIQVGSGSTLNLNNSVLNNNQASLGNSIYNAGTTTINQSSITNSTTDNSGGSIYNSGGNLSLTNNSSVMGGNIGLISNGSGNLLSLGNVSFSGQSGSNSLITDSSGTTLINGNITTTKDQIYNDAVTLDNNSNITANGSIDFNKTLDGSQNLSLSAGGDINLGTVGSLTPQIGLTINNAANVNANDVNVASLTQVANSGNTTLGNVTAGSGVINLTSANNITTGNITTNGQDINLNSQNITTGNLTSVAQNGGNGGNITMVSNNQNISTINAQGGSSGIGGTVDLTVNNRFQATGTFTDQNGTLSSISTSGGVGSGPITIRYGTGPFIVGDGTFVGTAGAIASSANNIISPPQTYYSTYTQGNISLIYRDATQSPSQQVITPEQVTTLPEQVLFPENTQFLPNSIIPNIEQSTLNQADLIKQTLSYNFSNGHTQEIIDSNVFLIEQLRNSEYTAYYGKNLAPLVEIQTAEDIKKSLRKIFEQTGKRSAVIYTLTQPESLEIIVVFPEGKVIYRNVKVKQEVLSSLTKDFRSRVVDPLKQGYKTAGQKIYNLLIAPIKADLVAQKIDTLLFSVDNGLRSIPMAALFDGHHFLVENYSLGLIPSISLMDTHYKAIKNAKILAMGASKFVEQNALPGVVVELPVVSHQLGQGRFFINQEFTVKNLQARHHEYPAEIIHLATHGEFNSGSPSNSFIQFWNKEKLRLDQIRKLHLQDPPIELLVLSACRTALGNEDVELGFAGLAIQSGSKSALASLWSVSDEGTLALMNEFYQNLKTSPIRAEAIQQAQIAMLKGKLYVKNGELQGNKTKIPLPPELQGLNNPNLSHPYYWAAFTMIGSPW